MSAYYRIKHWHSFRVSCFTVTYFVLTWVLWSFTENFLFVHLNNRIVLGENNFSSTQLARAEMKVSKCRNTKLGPFNWFSVFWAYPRKNTRCRQRLSIQEKKFVQWIVMAARFLLVYESSKSYQVFVILVLVSFERSWQYQLWKKVYWNRYSGLLCARAPGVLGL